MTAQLYIGIAAGIFSLCGYIPDVLDIVRGKFKPQRASWLIWTLSSCLILLSYYELGAWPTIWVPLAYVLGTATVTIFSFIYGQDGWGFLERATLVVAIVSAIRWIFFENVLFTLLINLAVSFTSYINRIKGLIRDKTEREGGDFTTWSLYSIGAFLNLFAINDWSAQISTLPIVYFVMNAVTFILIVKHKAKRNELS
jgi:hypothetical protein